ncbi:hypothetical protein F8M41_014529 [Gigaspora margarita]|uniref:F-box domain-containing protein n=1 Tax=Gigaspora margarita TaxID=4874 RepID=A0A8H4ENR8_GIGMA|nr:hypothetical protein F8M41_014529 [Gigaspora margarita]
MIQILPNELHIQILAYIIAEINLEKFCNLRTVCKKWNTFVPLIMSEVVVSKLKSNLKFGLADCSYKTVISKNLLPTYSDSAKTFTFLFDQTEDINISDIFWFNQEKPNEYAIKFIASIEKECLFVSFKLGVKFNGLFSPEIMNDDIYKCQLDHKSNMCFKRKVKVDEEGNSISHLRIYSLTIAAWKLYYILDCLDLNCKLTDLKNGFQYSEETFDYLDDDDLSDLPDIARRRHCTIN